MSLVLESVYASLGNLVFPHDKRIPLKSVEVRGEMIDFVAKIRISQTYINGYDRSIEAKYMFNLDGNSVITGMSMVIGDRVLVSKISEKSEARQTYERAISEKKTTCLLEKMSNGIYKVNVGNVLANQEVKIEFEYLTKLECTDEGGMKFVLPTNISPKYEDNKKTVQDMVASKGTTSSMTYTSSKAPFTFHLELNWKSSNEIMEVKSFTSEIEVKPLESNPSATKGVQITSSTVPSNGDFNVFVKTEIRPTVYVNMKGEDTYLMVNHRIPDEYADEGSSGGAEYVIIVDRSGSMGSDCSEWSGNAAGASKSKMDYAKEATELFVQSLPAGSRFNIVSFGSDYSSLFASSVEYTEESKTRALKEIAKFSADMGGTELFQCLSDVLSGQMKRGGASIDLSKRVWTPFFGKNAAEPTKRERIVILMTDGDVGNVDAVTSLIRQYNHVSRVFAIGIGQDVNRFLVDQVAKAANGLSEVLVDNPNIGTVVVKMLDASMKSYYRNPTLCLLNESGVKLVGSHESEDENGAQNKNKVIYPNTFESMFYKISTKSFLTCNAVQMSCEDGITGRPVHWDFPMNHSEDNSQENQWIAQLYAADLIRSLEERNANNEFTARIVRLSMDFSVMNDKTSFVVVDEETKTEKASSDPVPVTVPQYSGSDSLGVDRFRTLTRNNNSGPGATTIVNSRQRLDKIARVQADLQDVSLVMQENIDAVLCRGEKLDQVEMMCCMAEDSSRSFYKSASKSRSSSSSSSLFSWLPSFSLGATLAAPAPQTSTTAVPSKDLDNKQESDSTPQSAEERMDQLLKFKKVDGSFTFSNESLQITGWQSSDLSSFATFHQLSEELAFNLWILKWLKSDELKANKKYLLIVRNLEKWLKDQQQKQLMPKSSEEYLVAILVI